MPSKLLPELLNCSKSHIVKRKQVLKQLYNTEQLTDCALLLRTMYLGHINFDPFDLVSES